MQNVYVWLPVAAQVSVIIAFYALERRQDATPGLAYKRIGAKNWLFVWVGFGMLMWLALRPDIFPRLWYVSLYLVPVSVLKLSAASGVYIRAEADALAIKPSFDSEHRAAYSDIAFYSEDDFGGPVFWSREGSGRRLSDDYFGKLENIDKIWTELERQGIPYVHPGVAPYRERREETAVISRELSDLKNDRAFRKMCRDHASGTLWGGLICSPFYTAFGALCIKYDMAVIGVILFAGGVVLFFWSVIYALLIYMGKMDKQLRRMFKKQLMDRGYAVPYTKDGE